MTAVATPWGTAVSYTSTPPEELMFTMAMAPDVKENNEPCSKSNVTPIDPHKSTYLCLQRRVAETERSLGRMQRETMRARHLYELSNLQDNIKSISTENYELRLKRSPRSNSPWPATEFDTKFSFSSTFPGIDLLQTSSPSFCKTVASTFTPMGDDVLKYMR
jgi:hypothetical protein